MKDNYLITTLIFNIIIYILNFYYSHSIKTICSVLYFFLSPYFWDSFIVFNLLLYFYVFKYLIFLLLLILYFLCFYNLNNFFCWIKKYRERKKEDFQTVLIFLRLFINSNEFSFSSDSKILKILMLFFNLQSLS